MNRAFCLLAIAALVACSDAPGPTAAPQAAPELAPPQVAVDDTRLAAALAAQPEEVQARYVYRHPKETLEFFGIEPGMTVVEALPGGGWYSKILIDYLGSDGHLIGADYALNMYPLFGFFDEKSLEAKKTWVQDWTEKANGWRAEDDAQVSAFAFGSMPADVQGQADAVLFIRALHNLNRFEKDGEFLTSALKDANAALKPGGILGVVQHQARDEMPDEWADGSHGYLKKAALIATVEAAGFGFTGETDINQNPNDQPTADDIVWRLPPTLATSAEDPALKEKMLVIGESNRMTLRFQKLRD